jgi:uncharacterized membrane protein YqiK
MIAGELSVDVAMVGIVVMFVGLVALATWWSVYCQKRFRQS